ncbi:MAG: dTDP-4-amino-4,6-dideoxygalactose transaminase [Chthoniobacterales bacterium]
MIPFNKPYYSGTEIEHIREAFAGGQTAGNGPFTRRCQEFFESRYGLGKCLLTQSCTDALEMTALLAGIEAGDEVILPSYTFVSTANAFALRGAKLVFCDSEADRPHIDAGAVAGLVTDRTKAIVVVHYGGTAVEMEPVMAVAKERGILVIEDAAQAIDSFYHGRALGGIGDLATFSFHETKNVISGEGGLLVINRADLIERAEVLWEKGTNRSAFFRGEVAKYQWVDVGSSFLPSELTAATLWAQLEHLESIQARRMGIWQAYDAVLRPAAERLGFGVPLVNYGETVNGHLYYVLCESLEERTELIGWLRDRGIYAVFHYQSLHDSPYFAGKHDGRKLQWADRYSDSLVRLPLFHELGEAGAEGIAAEVIRFFEK